MAYVQSANSTTGSSSSSFACGFASNVVAGNLLVISVRLSSTTAVVSSVTDSLSNTWAAADAGARPSGAGPWGQLWYTVSGSSGANTVTGNWSASTTSTLAIGEYSAVTTLGETNVAAAASTAAANSGNITTSVTKTWIGGIAATNPETFTEGTGWTQREPTGANSLRVGLFDHVGYTATTAPMDAGISTSNWACSVAAFGTAAAATSRALPVGPAWHLIGR